MTRFRLFAAFGWLALAVLVVGCEKKSATTSSEEPKPDPKPARGEAEDRREARYRLKQIGLAMHNFADANAFSFPAGIVGPNKQLGLSWRVAILPFIEEDALYKEFKLNEPWDSEHNKKLIPKMPKIFATPGKDAGPGKTYIRSFAGPQAFVRIPTAPKGANPQTGTTWANRPAGSMALGLPIPLITDGSSNTLMVAEAAEAVEWTRPDELPFLDEFPANIPGGPKLPPLPKLGVYPGGFHGLMADGAVYWFPSTLSEKNLRAMLTVAGGETLDQEVIDAMKASEKADKADQRDKQPSDPEGPEDRQPKSKAGSKPTAPPDDLPQKPAPKP